MVLRGFVFDFLLIELVSLVVGMAFAYVLLILKIKKEDG